MGSVQEPGSMGIRMQVPSPWLLPLMESVVKTVWADATEASVANAARVRRKFGSIVAVVNKTEMCVCVCVGKGLTMAVFKASVKDKM